MPLDFDDLADDIHENVKCAFGETQAVTYLPLAGGSTVITGVFNDRHNVVDPDTERVIASNIITLGVKLADLPAIPVKNDKVSITKTGKTYRVVNSEEDGQGWTELFLHESIP